MNKNMIKLAASSVLLGLMACTANANDSADTQNVRKLFQTRFADRQVLSVGKTPVKGIYEVVLKGNRIVYVDQKVDYLFVGDLIDVAKRESLTEARQASLSRVDWKSLPLQYAIKEVRGNGERKMAVFTDPDCPFCKRLEREGLEGVTNVTIYTYLYPLVELHPDALHKSQQIWCASDRGATWTAFMHDGKALPSATDCDTSALARIKELGERLGINGTPGLVFANGRIVAGAIPKEEIEANLDAK
ncbi:DsbC family protein [Paludibacterium yongneupense]|uniref:DsbC family protein n=1 Tax=Paludibacterium yongneupense TaxID=400061 RepID=UPI00040C6005|nr:DsbC family protein [Paludibacterium yongneupense]